MNFGTHETSVNEVADLFRKVANSITFPNASHADIRTIHEATRAAWEEYYGEDELTWSDIRSHEMSSVWQAAYASEEFKKIEPGLKLLVNELSKDLMKHFKDGELEMIGEDVIRDMHNALYARAVGGTTWPFFESLIQAYQNSSWPCGWEGEYPQGRLLTFAPKKQAVV